MTGVRLTEYSHGAGCACKLGPDELAQVMGTVKDHKASRHPDLLVGVSNSDDAGVYSLGDGMALVQTVDIFTPVVDDPCDWGRIAAANALSDVYAMGGSPLTALQFIAWPRDKLDFAVAGEVVGGGMEIMESVGCTVVGGHSIDGPEPTYGFAVTGTVASDAFFTNAGARPGDELVLTKPLGLGVITTAIKRGKCPPDVARAAVKTMTTLNAAAGQALARHGASAATDVTGFGLLGHLREMCVASDTGARIELGRVPLLEGAEALLGEGMWAGGSQRNLKSVLPWVESGVDELGLRLLADAQTSGGLLVALPEGRATAYADDVPGAAVIGRITAGSAIEVIP
jgi:selenide,water dikinase